MLEITMDEIEKMETEIVDEMEYEKTRSKYQIKSIPPKLHKVIVGEAARLIDAVTHKGGTEDEIKKAIYYLKICQDTYEYNLDYIRYRRENGIEEIAKKYGVVLWRWKKTA